MPAANSRGLPNERFVTENYVKGAYADLFLKLTKLQLQINKLIIPEKGDKGDPGEKGPMGMMGMMGIKEQTGQKGERGEDGISEVIHKFDLTQIKEVKNDLNKISSQIEAIQMKLNKKSRWKFWS